MTDLLVGDVNFLTVAEVAGALRTGKMTVYRLVHDGQLEHIRVGRGIRIPERAVHKYLLDQGADFTIRFRARAG